MQPGCDDPPERAPLAAFPAARRPWHTLDRAWYHDLEVYRAEVERIWRRGWLFVGHDCEIPSPGDYFTYSVDGDELIVVRQADGSVKALHNVCRHRGSVLVEEARGSLGCLVCPYHQWVYETDGRLRACRGMGAEVDRSELSLKPAHARELEGLVYVCLAEEPPDFGPTARLMGPLARPQGFAGAKVAFSAEYEVSANWKLVWENNRECYHCDVNHPEYVRANFDRFEGDALTPEVAARLAEATAEGEARWESAGLSPTHKEAGLFGFPDPERGVWYSANRTVLAGGFVTESLDGRRVAPLMGDYPDEGVGTLRLRTLPNFWCHGSCDHAVTTRLTPAGPRQTRIRVCWLVARGAVEGRDYEHDRLLPFWKRTSEQDWLICERQQRGVDSRAYGPGPLSREREYNVEAFLRWYLRELGC